MSTKKYLVSIFVIGLLLRLYLFSIDETVFSDSVIYMRLGQSIFEQGSYTFGINYNYGITFPPMYPILIGFANLILDNLLLAGRIISLIASLLTILVMYGVVKNMHDQRSGLYAAFAFALYPFIVRTSVRVMSESLFILLVGCSLLTLILYKKYSKFKYIILYGISVSLAFLTRPEGLFLFIFVPFYLNPFKNIKKYLVIGILFILVISPYIGFLYSETGKLSLTGKASLNVLVAEIREGRDFEELFFSLSADNTQLEIYKRAQEVSTLDYILSDPMRIIRRFVLNMLEQMRYLILLLLPILLPLSISIFDRRILEFIPVFALISILLCVYAFYLIDARFLFTVVFLLIPVSAIGFSNANKYWDLILKKLRLKIKLNLQLVILFMILFSSVAYVGFRESFWDNGSVPYEHIEAGKSLDLNGSIVMSRKPWVAFFSGAEHVDLPNAEVDRVLKYADYHDVDYVVIDERLLSGWPYYEDLRKIEGERVYSTDKIIVIKI